eukprot:m.288953 g.288953  ORF g.288953 m.288953 type:complete len:55 (+) comp202761_c0_seq1:162-326(+)
MEVDTSQSSIAHIKRLHTCTRTHMYLEPHPRTPRNKNETQKPHQQKYRTSMKQR